MTTDIHLLRFRLGKFLWRIGERHGWEREIHLNDVRRALRKRGIRLGPTGTGHDKTLRNAMAELTREWNGNPPVLERIGEEGSGRYRILRPAPRRDELGLEPVIDDPYDGVG